jgi:hypothetical protein
LTTLFFVEFRRNAHFSEIAWSVSQKYNINNDLYLFTIIGKFHNENC